MRNSVIKKEYANQLETDLATYRIDENDVLNITQRKIEFSEKMIAKNFRLVRELIDERKMLMFCDLSDSLTYDKKSRLAFEEQSASCCIAMAMYSKSLLGLGMGNVFLALRRSTYPMRVFADKEKAMTWLLEQV